MPTIPTVLVTGPASGTYSGSPFQADGTVNGGSTLGGVGLTFDYQQQNATGWSDLGASAPSAPSNYQVTAFFAGSSPYDPAHSGPYAFSISQATPTLDVTWPSSGPYTNTPYAATGVTIAGVDAIPGNSLEGVPLVLDYYDATTSTDLGSSAPSAPGTYWARLSFAGSIDYSAANVSTAFTISQDTPVLTVTWPPSGNYTNTPYAATGISIAGVISGVDDTPGSSLEGVPLVLDYYDATTSTDLGSTAPSTPGTYWARLSFAGSTDYSAANVSTAFTISQDTPVLTVTWPSSGPYTNTAYAATGISIAGVISGVDDTPGSSLEGVPLVLDYYDATTSTDLGSTAPSTPGTYWARLSFAGSTDYSAANVSTGFTISQDTPVLTVTWPPSGNYTNTPYAATGISIAGVISGVDDTPGSSLEGVPLVLDYYDATTSTDLGSSAPSTPGTYWAHLSFAGSSDYSAANISTSFTISKDTPVLAVTWPPSGPYTNIPYAATGISIAGVISGVDDTPGSSLEGVPLVLDYYDATTSTDLGSTAPSTPGTYWAHLSFAGSTDYSAANVSTEFTISQATPTLMVSAAGGTFNGSPYPATATVAGVNGIFGATLEGIGLTLDYQQLVSGSWTDLGANAPSAAGSYQFTVSFAGSADYTSASTTIAFTIGLVTPTVIVSDAGGPFTNSTYPASASVAGLGGLFGPTLEGIGLTDDYQQLDSGGNVISDLGSTAPAQPGTYDVTASFSGSTDYGTASASVVFTIGPAFSILHDHPLLLSAAAGLLANATNASGDPIAVSAVNGSPADVGQPIPTGAGGTLTVFSDGDLAYLPAPGYVGIDSFTFAVSSGSFTTTATVTITVTDQAPVVPDSLYAILEGQSLPVDGGSGVLAGATDADGDPMTVSAVSGSSSVVGQAVSTSQGGTVTLNSDGSFTYLPPSATFVGSDSVGFTVSDGALTTTATLTIQLTAPLPVAEDDSYWVVKDPPAPLTLDAAFGVLSNDGDQDGTTPVTVSAVNGDTTAVGQAVPTTQGGSVTLNADGSFSYMPATGYVGPDSWTYTISDPHGNTASATVTVNVVDAVPVLTDPGDQSNSVADAVNLQVVATESDNETLSYSANGLPPGLSIDPNTGLVQGVINSLAAEENGGSYSVTVTVANTEGASVAQTFNWTVFASNVYPAVSNPGDQTNVEGDTVSLQIDATDPNGSLSYVADGLPNGLQIDPNTGLISGTVDEVAAEVNGGQYPVTVTAYDANMVTSSTTFLWTVTPNTTPPVAGNDEIVTDENTPVSVDVLANASSSTGILNPSSVTIVSPPNNGSFTQDPVSGAVTYMPGHNFTGEDSFTYTVATFEGGVSNLATATITVQGPDLTPVANDDEVVNNGNAALLINVLANDQALQGTLDPATVTITTQGLSGMAVVNPTTGLVTYTPEVGFSGSDSFTYSVQDTTGATSNEAIVSIVPVYVAPPVGKTDYYAVMDDGSLTVGSANSLLANDSSPSGYPLSAILVSGPQHGLLTAFDSTTGTFTYTPDPGFQGTDTLSYRPEAGGQRGPLVQAFLVALNVNVAAIQYNGAWNVPLKMDATTGISSPLPNPNPLGLQAGDVQWVRGARQQPNTTAAWNSFQSAPAAVVQGHSLSALVAFTSSRNNIQLTLQGTSTGAYGNMTSALALTVTNGVATGQFSSTQTVNAINAATYTFDWQVVSITLAGGITIPVGANNVGQTSSRIYTLYNYPIAPMATPWAPVLEIAAGMLRGQPQNDLPTIRQQMTMDITRSMWTTLAQTQQIDFINPTANMGYSIQLGQTFTLLTGAPPTQQSFDLSGFLSWLILPSLQGQQCYDDANVQTIFLRALGVPMDSLYIAKVASPDLNEPAQLLTARNFYPAGYVDLIANQVFKDHEVGYVPPATPAGQPVNLMNGLVYDPSIRQGQNAANPGSYFAGITLANYLNAVFPGAPGQPSQVPANSLGLCVVTDLFIDNGRYSMIRMAPPSVQQAAIPAAGGTPTIIPITLTGSGFNNWLTIVAVVGTNPDNPNNPLTPPLPIIMPWASNMGAPPEGGWTYNPVPDVTIQNLTVISSTAISFNLVVTSTAAPGNIFFLGYKGPTFDVVGGQGRFGGRALAYVGPIALIGP